MWHTLPAKSLKSGLFAVLCLFAVLAVTACGGAASTGNPRSVVVQPTATPQPTATATPQLVVVVHTKSAKVSGKSETVLADDKGKTLYYFTPDSAAQIACTGSCAQLWPPLLIPSGAPASAQSLSGTLAVLAGANGTQVTYNGHPLYTFSKDADSRRVWPGLRESMVRRDPRPQAVGTQSPSSRPNMAAARARATGLISRGRARWFAPSIRSTRAHALSWVMTSTLLPAASASDVARICSHGPRARMLFWKNGHSQRAKRNRPVSSTATLTA